MKKGKCYLLTRRMSLPVMKKWSWTETLLIQSWRQSQKMKRKRSPGRLRRVCRGPGATAVGVMLPDY